MPEETLYYVTVAKPTKRLLEKAANRYKTFEKNEK